MMKMSSTTLNTGLLQRMNDAKESPLFYKVFVLVTLGLMLDASDVYLASATNTAVVKAGFATLGQGSLFLSAGFMGLFIGSILAGFLGDKFGRNKVYSLNLFVFGLFTLLAGFAPNITMLTLLRFIASLGLGAEIVTGFALVNEFAPVLHRGRWAGGASVVGNLGSPLGLLLCTLLIPRYSWRAPFFVVGVLALLLWGLRFNNFPESPRWLMSQGRYDEAEKLVKQLEVRGTYTTKNNSGESKRVTTSLARGLFVGVVAAVVTTLAQFTFTSWVPTLLVKRGIDVAHSFMFSTVMMVGAPVGAFFGAMLVDWVGRKKTIVVGFLLTALLGVTFAYQTTSFMVMLVGFLLTLCMYAMNASILSVYVPELFQTKFRFRGEGYSAGAGKLAAVLMPSFVVWTLTNFGPTYVFFGIAVVTVLGAVVVGLFGPETKQRPVE